MKDDPTLVRRADQLKHTALDALRELGGLIAELPPSQTEDLLDSIHEVLREVAALSGVADVSASHHVDDFSGDEVDRVDASRRAAEAQASSQALARIAGRAAKLGGWLYSIADNVLTWSDETAALHEAPAGFTPSVERAIEYYAPEFRQLITDVFVACVEDGVSFDVETEIITANGRRLSVRSIGEAVRGPSGTVTHVQGAFQDITDKKAAAEQIRTLGTRLMETLDAISDAFCLIDHEWKFTFVNEEAENVLGRRRKELLGNSFWTAIDGFPLPRLERELERVITEQVTVRFEELLEPQGRWFELEAHPSKTGVAIYFRDATERRRNREALREGEERFRLLAKATHDAIWDWDLSTDAVWWNEGITSMFGFSLDEVEADSSSWTLRLHPEDRARVITSLQEAIEGDEDGWSAEYRFMCKDGTYSYVLDQKGIVRDTAGTALRVIGGMTDLTERKQHEEQLREHATLLDNANDAILVRDLNHNILYWNRSAERVYGWKAQEAVGRSIKDLLYLDPAAFEVATECALTTGEWVGQLDQITESGAPIVVEGHWTLMRDERGNPKSILAINTDVTQRKKLEAQFLRAQRMESIGALAGGIAHDLNNTLSPILMTISLLREDEADPDRLEDFEMVETCAERAAAMVRQLLTFARGSDEKRTLMTLVPVVTEIEKIVRDTFPKHIDLRISVEKDLWRVSANKTQMHQLITNLCVNARDAMPDGGTLTLAVEHIVLDEVYAGMSLEATPGPYVLIRVEDTGTGMPPQVVDRIFEPFFTTKEIGRGTGLGLSTAHAIVRNHGGFFHVYSELGQGTRFKIYLPADVAVATLQETAIAQSKLPRGEGQQVLVVDDEESIRTAAQRTLERFGYRVMVASNGAEAVSKYARFGDDIAVVLTDMSMPVMDGPATIVALKSLDPDVVIVGSSGLNENGNVAKAVGAGVAHFIPKPYTADTILHTIKKVLLRSDAEPGA